MLRWVVMAAAAAAGACAPYAPHYTGNVNPPAEHRVAAYGLRELPACESPAALGQITGAFASREAIYWGTGLQIAGFDHVRQTALRPWGREYVPQRFCTARAHFNDGKLRQVNYRVRETLHMFGNSWEVIWCVTGLDRDRTYAPACEQATYWN